MVWSEEVQERAKERRKYAKERSGKHFNAHKECSLYKNVLRIGSLFVAFATSTLSMIFRVGNGNGSVVARTTTGAAGYLLTFLLAVEAFKRYSEKSILHEQAAEDWEGLYQEIGDALAQKKEDPDFFLSEMKHEFASFREKYPAVKIEDDSPPRRRRSATRRTAVVEMV